MSKENIDSDGVPERIDSDPNVDISNGVPRSIDAVYGSSKLPETVPVRKVVLGGDDWDEEKPEKKFSPEIEAIIETLKSKATQIGGRIASDFMAKMARTEGWDASDDSNKRDLAARLKFMDNKLVAVRGEESRHLLHEAITDSIAEISKNLDSIIDQVEEFDKLPNDQRTLNAREKVTWAVSGPLEMTPVFTSSDWRAAYTMNMSWEDHAKAALSEQKRKDKKK